MSFQFSDRHIEEFQVHGVTVFRRILPPSLIQDLRRATDQARVIAHQKNVQAQRLQPIWDYDLDHKPFEDYRDLPELRDAVARILSPQYSHGCRTLGVLLEPEEMPYCMQWHRDARNILDDDEWEMWFNNWDFGNQVNCALYEDTCTWFVPGSHLRNDVAGEAEVGARKINKELQDKTFTEREQLCADYVESMPGAERLVLNAGDFALYRPMGWHTGNYVPYKKRATLHDGAFLSDALEYVRIRIFEKNREAAEETEYFQRIYKNSVRKKEYSTVA